MSEKILAAISIVSVIVLFVLYHILAAKKVFSGLFKKYIHSGFSQESIEFAGEKATGILLVGICPFIIFVLILDLEPGKTGLTVMRFMKFWYLYLILPASAVLISYLTSKNKNIQAVAPQLRLKKWQLKHFLLTVSLWLIYLFGYEYFFRGILWFLCYYAFGIIPALIINAVIYSAVHLPKGTFMSAGAIPLGILFCFMSYLTGSIYPAFLIHACMAISTELSAVYNNPEFQILNNKKEIIK
jgi:membrane protease YdiL (CAAX protease family)